MNGNTVGYLPHKTTRLGLNWYRSGLHPDPASFVPDNMEDLFDRCRDRVEDANQLPNLQEWGWALPFLFCGLHPPLLGAVRASA